ncbi:DNA alkylation repair protein [Candidatus Saccharibacteria bacterium]|nr:DNA alkylation repair protein [Candidatus Saccharibacteria bacterium]MCL1963010.1 DNA alkylation repair protein [Candidatus Saccharibacteria bacterium]
MNYSEIEKLFEQNRDTQNAIKMSAYMRDQFKFYGISSAARKNLYKDFLKKVKLSKTIDWEFLEKCWSSDYREFQYLALDYLMAMQKFLTYDDIEKLAGFAKSKQWWDTIDSLDSIFGQIGLTDQRVDDLMLKWSTDPDFWFRRIAIDHQLSRREKTDKELLAQIIKNNLGDKEFFINKAIGWSLREFSKTDANWVRKFVAENRSKMANLSVREALKNIGGEK